jgi:diguanylate cyclase (GGDEF)-like protein
MGSQHFARLFITYLVSALMWGGTAFALDPKKSITQYSHDVWRTEDGLPQNSINAIVQTRDGYIWIGTHEGLVRFDGVRFTLFDKGNTEAIKNNNIFTLFEDRQGSLWIGTGDGLVRLKDQKFSFYAINSRVISICQDRRGTLWLGSRIGLIRFQDGTLTTYTTRDGLADNLVRAVHQDRNGELWVGTINGLNRFKDGRVATYTTKDGLGDNGVWSIAEDRSRSLWIGTNRGLTRFKDGKFTSFMPNKEQAKNLVRAVREDRDGNLWIATYGGGLVRFNQGRFTAFTTEEGLSDNLVVSLAEDREGSLWIGTGGGLNCLKDGKFTTYGMKEGVSGDFIWSISEDRQGNLWIGTNGDGLNRFRDGTFTSFTAKDGLPSSVVYSICEDRTGHLWLGTPGGLMRLRIADFGLRIDDIRNHLVIYTINEGLPNNVVYSLYEDRQGNLWIGTNGGGVSRFKNGKFTPYTSREGLAHDVVRAIGEDQAGHLWVGTDSGLSRFEDERLISYTTKDGLSAGAVFSIHADQEGAVWISTEGGGLSRFKDGRFTVYSTREGLFSDIVYHILEDGRGNLWMSCNKGIFRVSKKELTDFADGKIRSITSVAYGTADGMKSAECNGALQPAGWRTSGGKLWFPTIKGAVMIDPDHTTLNELPPPVVIERVHIDKRVIDPTQRAKAPPGRGELEFHYAALSFVSPERVRFKYKLEGFDPDWVDAGIRREAHYTNIAPGNYRFRVIACNNDGVWNEAGAVVEFYLRPHFYQTKTFYALIALAIGMMAVGAYRFRVRQLKARARELARLVEERTQQLEEANQTLQRLATLDGLTGIANHRRFQEVLDHEWKRAARSGAPLSLIMLDIDFFKAYNDTYGHRVGDECLKRVARILMEAVNRPTDLVARYGGEEFAMILADTNAEGALTVAEKIRRRIEDAGIVYDTSPIGEQVTVSLGIATMISGQHLGPGALIDAADQALYQAKQEGRNRVKSYPITSVQASPPQSLEHRKS